MNKMFSFGKPWMQCATENLHMAEILPLVILEADREIAYLQGVVVFSTNKGIKLAAHKKIKRLMAEKRAHLERIATNQMRAKYFLTAVYSLDFPEKGNQGLPE